MTALLGSIAADQGICRRLDDERCLLEYARRKEQPIKASNFLLTQGPASGEDIERYEVVNGGRMERAPMGAFETVLASWFCHVMNSFAAGKKLRLAVHEVLCVLHAARSLLRRPGVAFVSYAHWPTAVVAREPAWNIVPDLAVEIVSPTNLTEEVDRKITDYFQAGVRLVWVFYPDSGRVYVYQSPTQVSIVERTDTLDGGEVPPGFRLPIESTRNESTRLVPE